MLEADTEYITLVGKHLPKDSLKDWLKSGKFTCTNKAIVNTLTKDKFPREKTKCSNCSKTHNGHCHKPRITPTSTTVSKEE